MNENVKCYACNGLGYVSSECDMVCPVCFGLKTLQPPSTGHYGEDEEWCPAFEELLSVALSLVKPGFPGRWRDCHVASTERALG